MVFSPYFHCHSLRTFYFDRQYEQQPCIPSTTVSPLPRPGLRDNNYPPQQGHTLRLPWTVQRVPGSITLCHTLPTVSNVVALFAVVASLVFGWENDWVSLFARKISPMDTSAHICLNVHRPAISSTPHMLPTALLVNDTQLNPIECRRCGWGNGKRKKNGQGRTGGDEQECGDNTVVDKTQSCTMIHEQPVVS